MSHKTARHPLYVVAIALVLGSCGGYSFASPISEASPNRQPSETSDTESGISEATEPQPTNGGDQLMGVNLAGADFGYDNLPGQFGTDYIYPGPDEIDYYTSKGMNVFRLPFLWERLQHEPFGDFEEDELERIDEVVRYSTSLGSRVILDPHNYGRYYDEVIGGPFLDVAAFEDFWFKLASHYRDNPLVIFGLMNEPADMDSELWLDDANAAIVSIRSTEATNLILVPGNNYTGAHSWDDDWSGIPNSELMGDIFDPIDNYAYELHQYLDDDSSGTSSECVSETIGSERLEFVTHWLEEQGKQGFLGEFAAADNPECLAALDNMADYMTDHSDIWLGWAYWAGGPWWGDDIYTIEPADSGADRAQMDVLEEILEGSG